MATFSPPKPSISSSAIPWPRNIIIACSVLALPRHQSMHNTITYSFSIAVATGHIGNKRFAIILQHDGHSNPGAPGSRSRFTVLSGPDLGSGSRFRPEGAEPEPDRTSASLHDSSQHRGFLEAMEDQDLLRPWSVLYYCSVLGKQRP